MKLKSNFTLIEMLVVIAIISILASMLMPTLRSALDTAKSVQCVNNLKQLSLGLQMYSGDFNGFTPPNTLQDGWAGYGVVYGANTALKAWWMNLYYGRYVDGADIYSDPVTNNKYAYGVATAENTNVSYGLIGWGADNDPSMIRLNSLRKPSWSIGITERTTTGGFPSTVPLRRMYGLDNPDSFNAVLTSNYLVPHQSESFNIQLFDGHVETKSIYFLDIEAAFNNSGSYIVKYSDSKYGKPSGYTR